MNMSHNDIIRCFRNRGVPTEHAKRIMDYVSTLKLTEKTDLEIYDIIFACIDSKYLVSPCVGAEK
jgi:hypothetical protein